MTDDDHEKLRLLATEVAPIFVAAIDRVLADRYAKEQEEIAFLRRARAGAEEDAAESRLALCNERGRTRTLMVQIGERDSAILAKQETIWTLYRERQEAHAMARKLRTRMITMGIARAEAARRVEELLDDAQQAGWERSERD